MAGCWLLRDAAAAVRRLAQWPPARGVMQLLGGLGRCPTFRRIPCPVLLAPLSAGASIGGRSPARARSSVPMAAAGDAREPWDGLGEAALRLLQLAETKTAQQAQVRSALRLRLSFTI